MILNTEARRHRVLFSCPRFTELYFARVRIVHIATFCLRWQSHRGWTSHAQPFPAPHTRQPRRGWTLLNRRWLPEGEHLRIYPLSLTSTSKGSNHTCPATSFWLTTHSRFINLFYLCNLSSIYNCSSSFVRMGWINGSLGQNKRGSTPSRSMERRRMR